MARNLAKPSLLCKLWDGRWIISCAALFAILLGLGYAAFVATPVYRASATLLLNAKQSRIPDLNSGATRLIDDTTEINTQIELLRSRKLMGQVVDHLNLVPLDGFAGCEIVCAWLSQFQRHGSVQRHNAHPRDEAISRLLAAVSIQRVNSTKVLMITVSAHRPDIAKDIADTVASEYMRDQIVVKSAAMERAITWLTGRVADLQSKLEHAQERAAEFRASSEFASGTQLRALERHSKELRDRIIREENQRAGAAVQVASLGHPEHLVPIQTRQRVLDLRAAVRTLETQISRQTEDLIALQQLDREAETIRILYEHFLRRLNELSAQQGNLHPDSRVLSNAPLSDTPSAPKAGRITAQAGLVGLALGAFFVLLKELRNQGFRSAGQLEHVTGYPVLGQIPSLRLGQRSQFWRRLKTHPNSRLADATRDLRSSLMLSRLDKPPQVILLTSALPGEGKTTTALTLAHNLTDQGKSVVLVEGDIRRRTFSEYFADLPKRGLVSVLSGDLTLEQALHRRSGCAVDVLGGEDVAMSAADLLASDHFRALVTQMRRHYDIIIVDTPPVLRVPDARLAAEVADAILFTVSWDKTPRSALDDALRNFRMSGQKITGLVLNRISPRAMAQNGYKGFPGNSMFDLRCADS